MALSRKNSVLAVIAIAGLAMAIVTGMVLLRPTKQYMGFMAEKGHYEAIVAVVDNQLTLQDSLLPYRLENLDDPQSLEALHSLGDRAARGQGAGCVWAMRKHGALQVWIETADNGHAGEYGYVFNADGSGVGWDADKYGERWSVDARLDAHWWAISYRLD
jgi:hypothetical protein